ncbi:MAG: hypothetical protein E7427_05920 [Ruminococcaceae bacterium]|nr:hypothetical protein [Oscillospiraceae bacterium]
MHKDSFTGRRAARRALCALLLCALLLTGALPAFAAEGAAVCALELTPADGTVTFGGTTYYQVTGFADGGRYLLGAAVPGGGSAFLAVERGGEVSPVWAYSAASSGGSGAARTTTLNAGDYTLSCDTDLSLTLTARRAAPGPGTPPPDGAPAMRTPGGGSGSWSYVNGNVYYISDDVSAYLALAPDGSFCATRDAGAAAAVTLYAAGETLSRCITRQPSAPGWVIAASGYLPPALSVGVDGAVLSPEIIWYAGGEGYADPAAAAAALTGRAPGVYPIFCTVSGRDAAGNYYRETSVTVNFLVAAGVLPDSFLVFSDVHEDFEMIGTAIAEVMAAHGGQVPALVVCTGDWVNGGTPTDAVLAAEYLPKIAGQLGGLDTVYVGGNHEPNGAVAQASIDAGLGAGEDFRDGVGRVFDWRTAAQKGGSSAAAGGLLVYGINYYGLGESAWSYDGVLPQLEEFLSDASERDRAALIVIAAHAGLHVLGRQAESVDTAGAPLRPWAGDAAYNIDSADRAAALLNRYANAYGMDILFLFGHDHSKGEAEFFLARGDSLDAVKVSGESWETLPLAFLYGHAGYLSEGIGSAEGHYTLFTWTDSTLTRAFARVGEASAVTTYPRLATVQPAAPDPYIPAADASETPDPLAAFDDVDDGAWYAPFVRRALERGVMQGMGDGVFAPDLPISRAMAVTALWARAGRSAAAGEATAPFSDVDDGAWYAPAVRWAAGAGIALGYPDGTFRPERTVTRQELAVLLCRAAGADLDGAEGALPEYADAQDIAPWARPAVQWLTQRGVLTGRGGGVFAPAQAATRAEMCAVLARLDAAGGEEK